MENNVTLHCPQCRQQAMQLGPELDLDQPFACVACGRELKLGELVTPAGNTLAQEAERVALDAFRHIPGLKPRR